jgi:hypothetical protein
MKIDFEIQTNYGMYRDALYFPDDQVPNDSEIEAMKQARVANWVDFILNPPPPPSIDVDENGNPIRGD